VPAGGRGFYLTNEGPLLNQALINAALHFAFRRGYKPVHTPFFMKQDIMAECAQLSQFDDELYKVTGACAKGQMCYYHLLNCCSFHEGHHGRVRAALPV
jgi:seryl-tRNA synthetase